MFVTGVADDARFGQRAIKFRMPILMAVSAPNGHIAPRCVETIIVLTPVNLMTQFLELFILWSIFVLVDIDNRINCAHEDLGVGKAGNSYIQDFAKDGQTLL
jgi:hypothetical protein